MSRRVVVAAGAAAAVVAVLAVAYHYEPVAGWDADVAAWVARSVPAWLRELSRVPSWFGGAVGMAVVSIAAALALVRRGRRRDGIVILAGYACVQLSTLLLKQTLDRPRPDVEPVVSLPITASYPSGHASGAVTGLVLAALLLGGRASVVVAALLAAAVGASRVLLGVHWTSDVVGGWALGAFWVAVLMAPRVRGV